MGSRRVLGNDPFQRGAAERTPLTPPAPPEESATPKGRGARPPSRPGGKRGASTMARASGKTGAAAPRGPSRPAGASSPSSGPGPTAPVTPPPVPLAASVVPEPPPARPDAGASAPSPAPADTATEPLRAPLAGISERPAGPAPLATSAPTLSWTPLPDALPPPAEEPGPAVERTRGGGTLVEVLREAPGLLAEAWSALEAAVRAVRAGLGKAGGEQLDVYGRDARLSEAVAPLVDFLYSRWFRVEVEGAAHVPAGGALLVANHAGALPLDGPMLHEALGRERPDLPDSRWLAEDQVFYAPLLGTLFNRLGAVRASPDSATRLLGEGRPVLIFPEGIQGIGKPFRDRYRLQRFGRGGFVKLALRTRRPILPVAIMGAEETLPLLGKLPGGLLGVPYVPVTPLPLPLPAKWRIRIGEPIAVPAGAKETDLSVVESLVDATRNTIEHMLRELLGARGGVFLG